MKFFWYVTFDVKRSRIKNIVILLRENMSVKYDTKLILYILSVRYDKKRWKIGNELYD